LTRRLAATSFAHFERAPRCSAGATTDVAPRDCEPPPLVAGCAAAEAVAEDAGRLFVDRDARCCSSVVAGAATLVDRPETASDSRSTRVPSSPCG